VQNAYNQWQQGMQMAAQQAANNANARNQSRAANLATATALITAPMRMFSFGNNQ
jgi:hypothetical protein